jgi:hypothetical protein
MLRTAQMYWVNGDANTVTSGTTYTPIPANHRVSYTAFPQFQTVLLTDYVFPSVLLLLDQEPT